MNLYLWGGLLTSTVATQAYDFEQARLLKAGGAAVQVEVPGYASPCLADVTGDGVRDLLVGQYSGGKIHVFPGKGDGSFRQGDFLKVGGEIVEIPGIW